MSSGAITYVDAHGETQVFYQPSPRQKEFHENPARYRLYGGAAGGGKSHALRMESYMRCLQVPGYRVLLLRRTLPELKSTHIREMVAELPLLGVDLKAAWRATDYTLTFPNGSILQFGHCDTDDAVARYLSTEYDAAAFDELTSFHLHHYRMIESRVGRRKGIPWTVMAGTNPVGIGSAWVKRLWITKDPDPDEAPNYRPEDYAYIPATIADNPHVSDDYEAKLESLPSEALRQAYRHGSWDFLEGQFFAEFRSHKDGVPWHVLPELPLVHGQDIRQMATLHWFRALDWGWTDPTICGWYACLPNGRIIKVYERTWTQTPAEQIAREIVSFTKSQIRGKVRYTVADPKMFTPEGAMGEDVADSFRRGGVPLLPADHNRVPGWHRLHSWLTTTAEDGFPLLQFWQPGCPRTTNSLPTLVRHKTKPDDTHQGPEIDDHAADETRYAMMSRPAPTRLKDTSVVSSLVGPGPSSELAKFMRRAKRPGTHSFKAFDLRTWQ